MPLCIGGGIRDYTDSKGVLHSALDVAAEYFRSGADKVWLGVMISHAPVCGVRCLLDGIGIRCQESIRVWCHRCMGCVSYVHVQKMSIGLEASWETSAILLTSMCDAYLIRM